MRVLTLSSVFPNPRQPALGVFVRERIRRLARHCELEVVAPVPWFPGNRLIRGRRWSGIPPVEDQGGLRVHHPRFLSVPRCLKALDGLLYGVSLLPFATRLRRRFPFDVIDAHFAYPDGLGAVLIGRALGCPVTITLRGSIVRLATYPSHRPQLRWALRHASGIMSVSRALRDVAAGLDVPPERIRVIPNGIDAQRFRPQDRRAARLACGLAPDGRVLLTVGGIYREKGQHLVLETLRAVLAHHPDLRYVIVGEDRGDGYRRELRDAIQRHDLEGRVLLVGSRPHEELPTWYAAADLFCLATRSEGWPNAVLEALACGIPVVATRVGGTPEIVHDGEHGRLVPFGDVPALRDAILWALGQSWYPEALARYARMYTWEQAATEVMEEFERLLAAGAAARIDGGAIAPGYRPRAISGIEPGAKQSP